MIILFSDPTICLFFSLLLGLLIGSFLNVVIQRLPIMIDQRWQTEWEHWSQTNPVTSHSTDNLLDALPTPRVVKPHSPYNLLYPRSHCPSCLHPIYALQNIPVLSYCLLKGRCHFCQTSISWQYPLVEVLCAVLTAYATFRFGYDIHSLGAIAFCAFMLAMIFIDLNTFYLPDELTLPLLWLGLLFNLGHGFTSLDSAVIGAALGYFSLWTVFWLFKLTTGKDGMGYGDFKLLAAIGAWLGWQMLPIVILLSSLTGAFVGIFLMFFKGRNKQEPMAFGPFLGCAGILALFFGSYINQHYLSMF